MQKLFFRPNNWKNYNKYTQKQINRKQNKQHRSYYQAVFDEGKTSEIFNTYIFSTI